MKLFLLPLREALLASAPEQARGNLFGAVRVLFLSATGSIGGGSLSVPIY